MFSLPLVLEAAESTTLGLSGNLWATDIQIRYHAHIKTVEGSKRTNSHSFINLVRKDNTVENHDFFLKCHQDLRFECIGSGNLFYSGNTNRDRP